MRRVLPAILTGLLALAALPAGTRAQDEGGSPSLTDLVGAAADSAAADSARAAADSVAAPAATGYGRQPGGGEDEEDMSFLATLSPKYTTQYTVDRQTTNWKQGFDFGTRFGVFSINNKTAFDVTTDSNRRSERRTGSNETTLRFRKIRRLPVTLRINTERVSDSLPNLEKQIDNSSVSLSTNWNKTVWGVRHTLNGGGSYDRRSEDSSQGTDRVNSMDAGWRGNVTWRTSWSPVDKMQINTNFTEDRKSKTSTLEDEDTRTETPTSHNIRNFNATANYNPRKWATMNLNYVNNKSDNESFLLRGGSGQSERQQSANRNLTLSLELKPKSDFTFIGRVISTRSRQDYLVRRDIASSGESTTWEGELKTRVLDADVELHMTSRQDLLRPETSADTDKKENLVEGKIARTLSRKITGQFDFLVRATQNFYSDPDPAKELDRDEFRVKIAPALTYTPGRKWTVRASYQASRTRRIELNPARASQTKEDEDFSVNFKIDYRMTTRTTITQNYAIKALFTQFDFNQPRDQLLSTQEIVTSVQSRITPRVNLGMTHTFKLKDLGPFRFREDGSRVFARSDRTFEQDMSAKLTYDVSRWATFSIDSGFRRIDRVEELDDRRTTTRRFDLLPGLRIQRSLGPGTQINASINYVQSSANDPNWRITSSLKKDF